MTKSRSKMARSLIVGGAAASAMAAAMLVPATSQAAAQQFSADSVSANVHAQCSLKKLNDGSWQFSSQGYPNSLVGYVTIKKFSVLCTTDLGYFFNKTANASVLGQSQGAQFQVPSNPPGVLCASGTVTFTTNATETSPTVCVPFSF